MEDEEARGKGGKRGEGVVTEHHCPAQLVYCTENDEDIPLAPSLWIHCQQQGLPSLVIHNCLSSTLSAQLESKLGERCNPLGVGLRKTTLGEVAW